MGPLWLHHMFILCILEGIIKIPKYFKFRKPAILKMFIAMLGLKIFLWWRERETLWPGNRGPEFFP